jgi:S-adenosylmethionine hydrolase
MAGGAQRAVELTNPAWHLDHAGATFAGRDVFAPVAAHLCNGVPLESFGPPIDPALLMPGLVPLPRTEGDALVAEVLWVDRYGNCQLNLGPDEIEAFGDHVRLRLADPTDPNATIRRAAVRAHTFAAIPGAAIGLVEDSVGMVAICMDQRSAAEELALAPGAAVTIEAIEESSTDEPGDPPSVPVRLGR